MELEQWVLCGEEGVSFERQSSGRTTGFQDLMATWIEGKGERMESKFDVLVLVIIWLSLDMDGGTSHFGEKHSRSSRQEKSWRNDYSLNNKLHWFSNQSPFKSIWVFIIPLQGCYFPYEEILQSHVAHLVNSDDKNGPKVIELRMTMSHTALQTNHLTKTLLSLLTVQWLMFIQRNIEMFHE